MMSIPYCRIFDQQTLTHLLEYDPLVHRYRAFFALFDWSVVPDSPIDPSRPGRRPHPPSRYIKALLLKIVEGLSTCTRLRHFLVEHPLLVLELGFRLHLDVREPYGFDIERTVPTDRCLREKQRRLSQAVLQALLMETVAALRQELAGLGEVRAFDVTHIYAWVRENNPRVYVQGTFDVTHLPKGDPDCRLGVKKSSNQQQADGSTITKKESLFGSGSGIATWTDPVSGDGVLAEYTLPFNEGDSSYFFPLYVAAVATRGRFPSHITADAAFDAWYTYQTVVPRGGIAAIALNAHGHPESRRDADGVPLCAIGLRMVPTFQFSHTRGYCSQRFRCPLLVPTKTSQSWKPPQFATGKGCVKDRNWELGGQMRVTLDRQGPLYTALYRQRSSTERGNSQSKALGLERPNGRNSSSVRNLNTLTSLVINARA
jgi:hypothetical protein